jgi:superfamily I DNA/RNA helicase
LESYDGTVTGACKVGTYTRVKGLDFKHVFLPCHDLPLREAQTPGIAAREHERLARRQLFVAVTRARDSLWLGSVSSG